MDWDDIQREFDRVNEMSCKPVGLQKYKVGHVCNVFHNIKSDDFYIGTASAIYCATGFPLPLNRSQMGALLGISEDTMIEKVVYNDFDCAYKSDLEGFNLDDTVKGEVEVKKMAVGIYYMGEILIPLATEDKKMAGLICWSQLAPVEDEIKNNCWP